MRSCVCALGLFVSLLASGATAHAFAGFYAGAAASDRTTVVVMRDGDRTVVSIQQGVRGAPDDLAWVLPVPASVRRDDVRMLRADAFERIERLSAPRLVELWEGDPCAGRRPAGARVTRPPAPTPPATFAEGAHELSILDGPRLTRWLRARRRRPPPGAEAAIDDYARTGHRFLVARLDASRVRREPGRVDPAPLRVSFRSDALTLPVRLAGPQELVVHVLARERYEAADRPNVLAPTNLLASERARERFGEVYASIFERVLWRHPGAAVTEYAWPAARCESCPTQPLTPADLVTLGGDVIGDASAGFVLSRLHVRLDGAQDLSLRPARPVAGGRGRPGRRAGLDPRVDRRAPTNAFQARYAILHAWRRRPSCGVPVGGRWGAPPGRRRPAPVAAVRGAAPVPVGRLRRFLRTWTPVLRIPSRGDAEAASER
ncbi:MAG TPA: DUF2330 domain-containing protein [Sandaracinaceae bacterium LLY-WYZ-13_1]|nr:DUF2330 domain-containing protein [Sandaracinaceae bacterium LLY-WYZ-13_1]